MTVVGDVADLLSEPEREDVGPPTVEEVGAAGAAALLAVGSGKAMGS